MSLRIKPLLALMLTRFMTLYGITRPQWVNHSQVVAMRPDFHAWWWLDAWSQGITSNGTELVWAYVQRRLLQHTCSFITLNSAYWHYFVCIYIYSQRPKKRDLIPKEFFFLFSTAPLWINPFAYSVKCHSTSSLIPYWQLNAKMT